MKKIISAILSVALCMGMVTAAKAAVTEINDGLLDTSNIYSSSGNLVFEEKKLGSYQNAQYATSNAGTMEVLYELDGMASFEVVTLNYNNTEDILFLVSNSADGEYQEVTDFSSSTEELGSNWKKTTYSGKELQNGSKYFKIVINQTKSKYIRLDNVKLLAKFDLVLEEYSFFADDKVVEGDNIYNANKLELVFNQKVEKIPELVISSDNGDELTVDGEYGEENNRVIYNFDELDFNVYSFSAEGFESSTETEYDFECKKGYVLEFNLSEKLYFENEYKKSDFVKAIKDKDGKNIALPEITVVSENTDVLDFEGDKVVLTKPGKAQITISFVFEGETIEIEKEVEVCGAKRLVLPNENISISAGSFESFPVKVELTDGTIINAENITAESTDKTVAIYEYGAIKGVSKGNAYIKFTVDYYGTVLNETVSVGVGKEALDKIANAEIVANRDEICVGEGVQLIVRGSFDNDTDADNLTMKKKFFSSNENILKVSETGIARGVSAGEAKVYAVVTLGGISVTTDMIKITVLEDSVYDVKLIVENGFMLKGDTAPVNIKAFTKTGEEIETANVTYNSSDSSILSVSGNILTAKKEGTVNLSATVEYKGESVDSEEVQITVKNSNGSSEKNFLAEANFNNVFAHSNGLYVSSGGGCLTSGTDLHNNYVIFEAINELKNVYIRWDSYGKNITGDIRLQVSADNVTYTEVSESEISIKEVTCHVVSSGQGYIFEYSGEKLQGMKYVKVFVDRMQGNTQITRLLGVRLDYDVVPLVIGVNGITKDNSLTYGDDAVKLFVKFSQDIDSEKLGNVILTEKETGKNVDISGEYTDGVYELNFNKLENVSHTLKISGFKNIYGTVMEDYSIDIEPAKEKNVTVKNVRLNGSEVSASIINNTGKDILATVVTAVYNVDGIMTGVYIDKNFEIKKGTNAFVSGGEFSGGSNAKVYIWSDMTDMIIQ